VLLLGLLLRILGLGYIIHYLMGLRELGGSKCACFLVILGYSGKGRTIVLRFIMPSKVVLRS
jgi:hypothetical protein